MRTLVLLVTLLAATATATAAVKSTVSEADLIKNAVPEQPITKAWRKVKV